MIRHDTVRNNMGILNRMHCVFSEGNSSFARQDPVSAHQQKESVLK
jgi:hypothetical protein